MQFTQVSPRDAAHGVAYALMGSIWYESSPMFARKAGFLPPSLAFALTDYLASTQSRSTGGIDWLMPELDRAGIADQVWSLLDDALVSDARAQGLVLAMGNQCPVLATALRERMGEKAFDVALRAHCEYGNVSSGALSAVIGQMARAVPDDRARQWLLDRGERMVRGHGVLPLASFCDALRGKASDWVQSPLLQAALLVAEMYQSPYASPSHKFLESLIALLEVLPLEERLILTLDAPPALSLQNREQMLGEPLTDDTRPSLKNALAAWSIIVDIEARLTFYRWLTAQARRGNLSVAPVIARVGAALPWALNLIGAFIAAIPEEPALCEMLGAIWVNDRSGRVASMATVDADAEAYHQRMSAFLENITMPHLRVQVAHVAEYWFECYRTFEAAWARASACVEHLLTPALAATSDPLQQHHRVKHILQTTRLLERLAADVHESLVARSPMNVMWNDVP